MFAYYPEHEAEIRIARNSTPSSPVRSRAKIARGLIRQTGRLSGGIPRDSPIFYYDLLSILQ